MNHGITLTCSFRPKRASGRRRQHKVHSGVPVRVPRISRLMALAIYFEHLLNEGIVSDQAEIARLGDVTRARVTQIMNLLNLAPEIQESILFFPHSDHGRDRLTEREVRPIAALVDWQDQRSLWRQIAD